MLRSFRNRPAGLVLLGLLAADLTACTTNTHVDLSTDPKPNAIAGLTTRSGDDFAFEPIGATISDGKLYGTTVNGQVVIPTDSIAKVWVKQPSTAKTVGLVVGLGVVLVGFVYLANNTAGGYSCTGACAVVRP